MKKELQFPTKTYINDPFHKSSISLRFLFNILSEGNAEKHTRKFFKVNQYYMQSWVNNITIFIVQALWNLGPL